MKSYTKSELEEISLSVKALREKLSPVNAKKLDRMASVVFDFEYFLDSFDSTPQPQNGPPMMADKKWHQEGRFIVDMEPNHYPARRLLMLNGSSVVGRRLWDYDDYCAAMAAIPQIYSAINGYHDLSDVNLYMAEGFVRYLQP